MFQTIHDSIRRAYYVSYALMGKASIAASGIDAALLQRWSSVNSLQLWQRQKFRAQREAILRRYYCDGTTTEERERLKALCLGGGSGTQWAKSYVASRFWVDEEDRRRAFERRAMFQWLEDLLGSNTVDSVHQVGCSSGRELAFFARRHPHVRFVGSDVYADVVSFCVSYWKETGNLEFTTLDLTDGEAVGRMDCDVVFSSGTLPYLDQMSVLRYFEAVQAPGRLLLVGEPLQKPFWRGRQGRSTRRANFQWNHPYDHYLDQAGWSIRRIDEFLDENSDTMSVSVHATLG